ncbi:MAG TPA: hypothetical protein VFU22_24995 [Roseiflexaceae bacterium]|nr:hypothetical protein [Roseiflexaceae bacterium]
MTIDTRTPAEIKYDAERDGSAYVKPQPADERTAHALDELIEDEDGGECPDCTPKRDCPACLAKYEAEQNAVRARAAAAETALERAEILLDNHEMPDGDQIFDVLLEDRFASFVWWRCIDWVLWRQANGKPVKRCGTDDDCPAAIDARFTAARDYAKNSKNWSLHFDARLLNIGRTIEMWERTPEEQPRIRRTNETLIRLFEAIEADL